MKAAILVSLLLMIPLDGTVRRFVPYFRTKSLASSNGQAARWKGVRAKVRQEFAARNYLAAAAIAQKGYRDALQAREPQVAARFLNNVGACRFVLHQYQEALQAYLKARELAETAGDQATAGALDFNISSLYSQLGQMDAAIEAARRSMARLSGGDRVQHLPKLLIHQAVLRAGQDRMPEALALYQQGIRAADRAADQEMCAIGWNDLGFVRLERKEFPQAERALLEAYRIRKLNRFQGLANSYSNLGILRLQQGDLVSASALLDQAVELSRDPGGTPDWQAYGARGRVRLAENRLPDALDDLRIAAQFARTWRRSAPPDDATRVSAENSIQEVHSALVEAGNRLYFTTHRRALAEETFQAAEANRAASLQTLVADPRDWRRSLPPEYYETLQKLESAEVDLLRGQSPSSGPNPAERVQMLRGALIQWESRAGSNADVEMPDLLERTRGKLGPDAALLSFHLASPNSYLWAVSRGHFALYRLPPAAEIGALVDRFQKAVRDGSGGLQAVGSRLFGMLFGQLDPAFQEKPRWLLALDAQLFELPFAALTVETPSHRPVFLAERHSLETISSAGMLASAGPARPDSAGGPFVGVADAVYNRADPRWPHARPSAAGFASFWNLLTARASASTASGDLHLARLAGSALEIKSSAAAWGGPQPPVLLEGAAANRRRLQAALNSHPAVLHFAAHVLHSQQGARSGLIVLSLADTGQPELLSPAEIAAWHLDGAVVSLSGCGSGSADALPATGLMGLTRAWLGAGANAVVASRWPNRDDSSALFLSFYRHLREAPQAGPPGALQQAQLDMLRSHTWRSSPLYWGAYFLAGNQP